MESKILTFSEVNKFMVFTKLCWRGPTNPDWLWVIWLRHTCWWQHCSSSWAGSHSWPPRTHGGWFGHRAPRRCGWPPSSWHRNRSVRWTCSSVCGPAGYTLPDLQAPLIKKKKKTLLRMFDASYFVHVASFLKIRYIYLETNSMKMRVLFHVFTLNFIQQLYI